MVNSCENVPDSKKVSLLEVNLRVTIAGNMVEFCSDGGTYWMKFCFRSLKKTMTTKPFYNTITGIQRKKL